MSPWKKRELERWGHFYMFIYFIYLLIKRGPLERKDFEKC